MDFIISYKLQNKLKNLSVINDELKELKEEEERFPIRLACSRCGQNPYLCQCISTMKHSTIDKSKVFNPEKDNY